MDSEKSPIPSSSRPPCPGGVRHQPWRPRPRRPPFCRGRLGDFLDGGSGLRRELHGGRPRTARSWLGPAEFPEHDFLTAFDVSPKGDRVAVSWNDGVVRMWDAELNGPADLLGVESTGARTWFFRLDVTWLPAARKCRWPRESHSGWLRRPRQYRIPSRWFGSIFPDGDLAVAFGTEPVCGVCLKAHLWLIVEAGDLDRGSDANAGLCYRRALAFEVARCRRPEFTTQRPVKRWGRSLPRAVPGRCGICTGRSPGRHRSTFDDTRATNLLRRWESRQSGAGLQRPTSAPSP